MRWRIVTPQVAAIEAAQRRARQHIDAMTAEAAAYRERERIAYADPAHAVAILLGYLAGDRVRLPVAYVAALARRAEEGDSLVAGRLTELTAMFADDRTGLVPDRALVLGWRGLPRIAYARADTSLGAARLCALMGVVVKGMDGTCPQWLGPLLRDDATNPGPWASLAAVATGEPGYSTKRHLRRARRLDRRLAAFW